MMNTKQLWSFNKIMSPLARLEWEEGFLFISGGCAALHRRLFMMSSLRGIVKKFVLACNLKGGYRVLACLARSDTTLLSSNTQGWDSY
jgi:hypothetical protein